MKFKKLAGTVAVGLGTIALLTGCVKPHEKPELVEIKPNQTAFVIPLEGKTSDQAKFESEGYLKDKQVATKRIEIPHRYIQTGRRSWQGEWIDTVRVIVVDRYPETREWADNKAFVGESKDSIKFNQGMSATAQILEEDASTFLYQYSGKTLKEVMDKEIRNKIGSVLLEKYSTMSIDDIRKSKTEVIEYVRSKVEPYFKEKGITLSNIGYIDDLQYLQSDIQESINEKFKAEQQQKAQKVKNETEIAQAKAEKKASELRKEAMEEISEMKRLEIQAQIAEGLNNGNIKLPDTLVIGEGGNMLFDIPVKGSK